MSLSKIIVIADGGLANRLRPIFSALALAELNGLTNSDVSVYWEPTSVCDTPISDLVGTLLTEEDAGFVDRINSRTALVYREGSVKNAVKRLRMLDICALLEKCAAKSLEKISNVQEHVKQVASEFDTLIIFDNQPLSMGPVFYSLYIQRIKKLVFVPEIEDSAATFLSQNKLHRDSLGVHARGTDFVVPYQYYSSQIIREDLSRPWFFASDSHSFNALVAKQFEHVVLRTKSLPQHSQGILGFGKNIYRSGQSVSDAAIDLRILASVNMKIFHPNSTFAIMASECSRL